jgi:hypothetical protein
MAIDTRNKDASWRTRTDSNHFMVPQYYQRGSLAVLMDIRDELKRLNKLLHCSNFVQIPATLRGLRPDIAKLKKEAK